MATALMVGPTATVRARMRGLAATDRSPAAIVQVAATDQGRNPKARSMAVVSTKSIMAALSALPPTVDMRAWVIMVGAARISAAAAVVGRMSAAVEEVVASLAEAGEEAAALAAVVDVEAVAAAAADAAERSESNLTR
ncbi:MAG: hypothetical protein ABW198_03350 [Pseudorhodoplanes sp.]